MRIAVAFLVVFVGLAGPVDGRILDDFTQGTTNLISNFGSPTSHESTGLDPAHTVGGVRYATVHDGVILRINYSAHSAPTPPPRAVFDQGIVGPNSYGELSYGNDSPLGIDLIEDGSRHFQVTLSGHQRLAYLTRAALTVTWLNQSGIQTTDTRSFGDLLTHEGDLVTGHIPFRAFGDLTNVSQMVLRFNDSGLGFSDPPQFAVHLFATAIPEPSAISLAAVGAVAMLRSRAKNRASTGGSFQVKTESS